MPELRIVQLAEVAVVVDAARDDVAVARQTLHAGTVVEGAGSSTVTLRATIQAGHRFAIRPVASGSWVHQYAQPFARSRGLLPGDPIDPSTVINEVPHIGADEIEIRPPVLEPWSGVRPTFMGFKRPGGAVGVRNWVLILPTSMCSSHEASTIAMRAEASGLWSREKYPNVDGVTAIPHTRGCGCPDYEPRAAGDPAKLTGVVEASMNMLGRYIAHPNVGAVLVIELGCEKTNIAAVGKYVSVKARQKDEGRRQKDDTETQNTPVESPIAAFARQHGKPILTLSVQSAGGTAGTIKRGLELLPQLLEAADRTTRTSCDASSICVGLKCGGSDAFSGLTANPALGVASDLLIRAGGRSIITEIPEFFGAEHLFAARSRSREVAREIYGAMDRFRAYVSRAGGSMTENPSPGNKEGGLINITIKSLGALAKSGRAAVEGVLDYGQWIWDQKQSGLWLLYCPSYDQESTPALVGSGCQIVCFTTGRGTGIGNPIAPVIKIGSNGNLYKRMGGDIDVNAGIVLDDGISIEEMGRRMFEEILAVASGKVVKAEENGHREFMIWSEEGVSL